MSDKDLAALKKEFDDAKAEHAFWTSAGKCEPGSPKWAEVGARYQAARDAYDFGLREQNSVVGEPGPRVISADVAKRVFVIHGRDERIRQGAFSFLHALDLEPMEWIRAIQLTGKSSPYIGEILDSAFGHAQAVIVLLTPDDETRLRADFLRPDDAEYEKRLVGQARPNVLFEAGMSFASHPTRTVLIQFGNIRPFSDIAGRHVVKMDSSIAKRRELALKIETAGCAVNWSKTAWQTAGDLTPPVDPTQNAQTDKEQSQPLVPQSKLHNIMNVVIAPVSKSSSQGEFFLLLIDEMGVVIRLASSVNVRIPRGDYIESWDDALSKSKLILTRKYFQGYFPGHEHATEYFLPR